MPGPIEASANRQALLQQLEGPPTPTQKPGIGIAPYATLFGGQGADIATTLMALQRPGARETNPLGAPGVLAAKAAAAPLIALLMKKMAKSGHPTLAKTMGYGVGAAGAVPAAWNIRQMAK